MAAPSVASYTRLTNSPLGSQFFSNISERLNLQEIQANSHALRSKFANLRPVTEFFDFKRVSKPVSYADAQSRANYNLAYFSTNYMIIFAMLSIYSLLTNVLLLFVIILVLAGMYLIGKLEGRDLDIGPIHLTCSQLYTGLLVIALPLGIFASPFSTLLWLLGASGAAILGHAIFLEKPIESAFAEETV